MKKLVVGFTILAILAIGFFVIPNVSAGDDFPPAGPSMEKGMMGGQNGRGGEDGPLHDLMSAAIADALGITVEQLDAYKEEGVRLEDVSEDFGLTADELHALIQETRDAVFTQAVEDGIIPERDGQGPGRPGDGEEGPLHDLMNSAIAEALGISVEQLEAYREEGVRLEDVSEDFGLTADELHALIQETRQVVVAQAIEDGVIPERDGQGQGGPGNGGGGQGHGGQAGGEDGPLHDLMTAAISEALGISVEQLDAYREEGVKLGDICEELGLTTEEFRSLMQETRQTVVEQAVEDGIVPERDGQGPGGPKGGSEGMDNNGGGGRGNKGNNNVTP